MTAFPVTELPLLQPSTTPQVCVIDVTPGMADEWLLCNETNRTFRPWLAARYARDMATGSWSFAGDPIRRTSDGVLLDGQHRLAAIVESGVTVRMVVIDGVEPDAQLVMDSGAKRTFGDNLSIQGETSYNALASIVRILAAWGHGDPRRQNYAPTHPELANYLRQNPGVRASAEVGLGLRRQIPVLPTAAGAAHYRCSQLSPGDAREFFGQLGTGNDLSAGDSVLALRKRLIQAAANKERLNRPEQLWMLVYAWNARRRGMPIKLIKLPVKGITEFPVPR